MTRGRLELPVFSWQVTVMHARAPRSAIEGSAPPSRSARRGHTGARLRFALQSFAISTFLLAMAATGWLAREQIALPLLTDRLAGGLGFAISRIDVRGNSYTQRADVVAAIGLAHGTPQTAVNVEAAQSRVEALPWVATALIRRDLPDGIVVDITERRPAILWRQPGRDTLLDRGGRELATLAPGSDLGLPIVEGEKAGAAATDLIALLDESPGLRRLVARSRRVDQRRWTLDLTSGAAVHLPAEGLAGAVAWLESRAATGLLDMPLEVIDLRVAGQLVVRPRTKPPGVFSLVEPRNSRSASAGGGAP